MLEGPSRRRRFSIASVSDTQYIWEFCMSDSCARLIIRLLEPYWHLLFLKLYASPF